MAGEASAAAGVLAATPASEAPANPPQPVPPSRPPHESAWHSPQHARPQRTYLACTGSPSKRKPKSSAMSPVKISSPSAYAPAIIDHSTMVGA